MLHLGVVLLIVIHEWNFLLSPQANIGGLKNQEDIHEGLVSKVTHVQLDYQSRCLLKCHYIIVKIFNRLAASSLI